MQAKFYIAALGLLTAVAHAKPDGPLTAEEFQTLVAKPFGGQSVAATPSAFEVHLKLDGTATISSSYNDVGTWRRNGDNGYCTKWNKQRPAENCFRVVHRDGKIGVTTEAGQLGGWLQTSTP